MERFGKGRKRLSIAVSDELDEKLQKISEAYGVPKSTLCTMYIAQGATNQEIALNAIQNASGAMTKQISDAVNDAIDAERESNEAFDAVSKSK